MSDNQNDGNAKTRRVSGSVILMVGGLLLCVLAYGVAMENPEVRTAVAVTVALSWTLGILFIGVGFGHAIGTAETESLRLRLETAVADYSKYFKMFEEVACYVERTLRNNFFDNEVLQNLISFVNGLNRQIRLLETEKQRLEQELATATAELEVQREFAAAVVKPAGEEVQ